MPISPHSIPFPLVEIRLDRSSRQRRELDPSSIIELATSIAQNQWVSPILVDESSKTLIAGERRYTAVSLLNSILQEAVPEGYLVEDIDPLSVLCKSFPPDLPQWAFIPVQFGTNLLPIEIQVFEFIENKERKDLSWQDTAKAVHDIHAQCLKDHDQWSGAKTAKLLNISKSYVHHCLSVWTQTQTEDVQIKQVVEESRTLLSAAQAIERVSSRKEMPLSLGKFSRKTLNNIVQDAPKVEETKEPICPILCADFHEFASTYSGRPFNFLHCDFPYGVNFNKGPGQNTAVATKVLGEYDDDPEVYWKLLQTLASNQDKLIAPSAHVMFWYTQTHEDATKEFFTQHFPQAVVQPFKMIWHCSDNSGIMPDPQRYGRRTYETAFLLTFGDRKIVNGKALSIGAPRESTYHRSQKPLTVLNHFFEMFVDSSTTFFDPTCGSGTSIISAFKGGAGSVLGLELDPNTHERAVKHYKETCL